MALAVSGSLLLTALVMLMGIGRVFKEIFERSQKMTFTPKDAKELSITAIEVIELARHDLAFVYGSSLTKDRLPG